METTRQLLAYKTQWSSFDFYFSSYEPTSEKFQLALLQLAAQSRRIKRDRETGEKSLYHLTILKIDRAQDKAVRMPTDRSCHPWHVFGELEYTAKNADWQAVCQQFHKAQRPPGVKRGTVLYYPEPPRVVIKEIACKVVSIVQSMIDECDQVDEKKELSEFLNSFDIHGTFHATLQKL